MSSSLVTIATFASNAQGQLARSRLEAAGILAFVINEAGAGLVGDPGSPSGAVQLQVPTSQARQALAILRSPDLQDAEALPWEEEDGTLRCLICQSSQLEAVDFPLPIRALRSLVLMVLPIPRSWLESRTLRCGLCGHEWTPEAQPPTPPV